MTRRIVDQMLPPTVSRRGLLAGAFFAAAFSLAAPDAALAQTKGEIKIAHIYSKTGPLEAYGKQTATGFMMGLDYATGGTMMVAGRDRKSTRLTPVT